MKEISKNKNKKRNKSMIERSNISKSINEISNLPINKKLDTSIDITKNILEYNDLELNSLSYEEALKNDRRTYVQYYISLLRTKHLLFFSFYPNKDYNSRIIKIFLFFFNFSSHFTINALFYSDSLMHQIYEDKGSFNFIYQIPQIIYSSVLSGAINALVKFLSLTEGKIIELKQEKYKNEKFIETEYNKLLDVLKIKFIIFFTITPIFLLIFWFYITCFCGIYMNTQIHLIEESLLSFLTSFIYPFAIYLLPGMFRIPALREKQKDKKLLYGFSKLLTYL